MKIAAILALAFAFIFGITAAGSYNDAQQSIDLAARYALFDDRYTEAKAEQAHAESNLVIAFGALVVGVALYAKS